MAGSGLYIGADYRGLPDLEAYALHEGLEDGADHFGRRIGHVLIARARQKIADDLTQVVGNLRNADVIASLKMFAQNLGQEAMDTLIAHCRASGNWRIMRSSGIGA